MGSSEKKIQANIILEIIGRPPEHLTETLEALIKKMGEGKGVKVVNKKINPPVLIKEQKDFYTSFAEIELEVDEIAMLAAIVFSYMPSHIEVISPQNVSLSNVEFGDVFSEITRRLHGYDDIVRIVETEKMILEKKLKEILEKDKKEIKE